MKNYKVMLDCKGKSNSEIINEIFNLRKIDDIYEFITPSEKHLLGYEGFKNIDKAVNIVIDGINNNKKFKIHYDVDLDGIMSGTQIYKELKHFTDNISWYINNGKSHGILEESIDELKDCDILIVVDSLNSTMKEYDTLKKYGVDVIVLDHHDLKQENSYDDYITLVSSNERTYNNPDLSGSGVVWKFCKYIDSKMNTSYADDMTDLAMAGIIGDMCDVSTNSMENRYICWLGLNNLKNTAIKKIVGSFDFNSQSISFSIAPLVNASMRMRKNKDAVLMFMTEDEKELKNYIKSLKGCREEQNGIVDLLIPSLINQADEQNNNNVLFLKTDTKADVSGLLGNKFLNIYNKPLFVLKDRGEFYGGSGRGIGIDDFKSICNRTDLCKADGHPNAFGITVDKSNFEKFCKELNLYLSDLEIIEDIIIDAEIDITDVNRELIKMIKESNLICGTGFKPFTFKISNITNYDISNMSKGKHLVINTDYLHFIKWNWIGSFNDMEENSFMCEPITMYGELDSGFIGRNFWLKMILSEFEVG